MSMDDFDWCSEQAEKLAKERDQAIADRELSYAERATWQRTAADRIAERDAALVSRDAAIAARDAALAARDAAVAARCAVHARNEELVKLLDEAHEKLAAARDACMFAQDAKTFYLHESESYQIKYGKARDEALEAGERIVKLTAERDELKEQIATMRAELANLRTERDAFSRHLADAEPGGYALALAVGKALKERDEAVADRDRWKKAADTAHEERDEAERRRKEHYHRAETARHQHCNSERAHKLALEKLKIATSQRDAAFAARDEAVKERDAWKEKFAALGRQLNAVTLDRDAAVRERDVARAQAKGALDWRERSSNESDELRIRIHELATEVSTLKTDALEATEELRHVKESCELIAEDRAKALREAARLRASLGGILSQLQEIL